MSKWVQAGLVFQRRVFACCSGATVSKTGLVRGLAGWVIVEFTVTEAGTVRDPVVV